jgi:hypothetical protein
VLTWRPHGITKPSSRSCPLIVALAAVIASLLAEARAAEPQHGAPAPGSGPPPAWPSSPFHGVIDGATGLPIPCLCRYQGIVYRLGDTVCMNTHLGRQLTRCDLFLNNTSWVPTGLPCTTSALPQDLAAR